MATPVVTPRVAAALGIAVTLGALALFGLSGPSNAAKKAGATATKSATPTTKPSYNVEDPYEAPGFVDLQNWVNSKPLQLADLKGKVVLINFWTFGCINCRNTIPNMKDLYAKYHDKGFEIVGIEAPEFDYEKEAAGVAKAVKELGITWPVASDNRWKTWRQYKSAYWPGFFYLDKTGKVRHTHVGEGGYKKSHEVVAALLAEPAPAP